MTPVAGNDIVMALNYSKSGPAPEAFYAYTLFIPINPNLIATGQELSFPGEGFQPFLLETRAPYLVCSSDLTGSIRILEVTDAYMRVSLTVNSTSIRIIGNTTGKSSSNGSLSQKIDRDGKMDSIICYFQLILKVNCAMARVL